MPHYRKKPIAIEAILFTGQNVEEILSFIGDPLQEGEEAADFHQIDIETLEGTMAAKPGDWVIKGVKGEFYPCKPDIFDATYEPADEPAVAA